MGQTQFTLAHVFHTARVWRRDINGALYLRHELGHPAHRQRQ